MTWPVVGLSSRRHRPSYGVAEYLKSAGYRVIPVNPKETEILGEKCYARLEDIPERVDIVDIFRRSEFVNDDCFHVDSPRARMASGERPGSDSWFGAYRSIVSATN